MLYFSWLLFTHQFRSRGAGQLLLQEALERDGRVVGAAEFAEFSATFLYRFKVSGFCVQEMGTTLQTLQHRRD